MVKQVGYKISCYKVLTVEVVVVAVPRHIIIPSNILYVNFNVLYFDVSMYIFFQSDFQQKYTFLIKSIHELH